MVSTVDSQYVCMYIYTLWDRRSAKMHCKHLFKPNIAYARYVKRLDLNVVPHLYIKTLPNLT